MRLSVKRKLVLAYILIGSPLAFWILYKTFLHRNFTNIYFLVFAFFAGSFMAIASGSYILKPLTILSKHLEDFSRIDFKPIRPIRTGDEFEIITKRFNQLNNRLLNFTIDAGSKSKELETIIANMRSGIIMSDSAGNITRTNHIAEELLGCARGRNFKSCRCLKELYSLDGKPIEISEHPIQKLLNNKQISNYLLKHSSSEALEKKILSFRGTTLRDNKGLPYGAVLMFLDVTKEYQGQEKLKRRVSWEQIKSNHLSILHDISLKINKEKDVGKILKTVIEAAAAITEARSGILLQKKDGLFQVASIYNWNPKRTKYTQKEIAGYLDSGLSKQLFKDKKPITTPNLASLNPNQDIGVKSYLAMPITDNKQHIIGLMALFNKKSNKRFTIEDQKIAQILSAHAMVALTNAINYEREHNIAQILQRSLLPSKSFTDLLAPNIHISLAYKSATQEAMVGGDFYDFIDLGNDQAACLIADVNGKGIEAAAMTSLAKSTITAFAYEDYSAAKVLEKTNKVLHNQTSDSTFITAIYGVLDLCSGIFTYANAGHHPPLHYRYQENKVLTLKEGSTPLGLLPHEQYELHQFKLVPNDSLVLYTDGLVEGRSGTKFFGENRLKKSVLAHAVLPERNIADKILADAEHFTAGKLTDDIALLVLRVNELAKSKKSDRQLLPVSEPLSLHQQRARVRLQKRTPLKLEK